jgi:hypothetical protein
MLAAPIAWSKATKEKLTMQDYLKALDAKSEKKDFESMEIKDFSMKTKLKGFIDGLEQYQLDQWFHYIEEGNKDLSEVEGFEDKDEDQRKKMAVEKPCKVLDCNNVLEIENVSQVKTKKDNEVDGYVVGYIVSYRDNIFNEIKGFSDLSTVYVDAKQTIKRVRTWHR